MDIDVMPAVVLSQAQEEGLQKLLLTLGPKGVEYLIVQGEEEVNKRIHMLDEYNKALVENVKAQMPSSAPSPIATMAQEVARRPNPYKWKSLSLTARKMTTLCCGSDRLSRHVIADITYEPYRVGFATGKLGGSAKQWALTCGASLQDVFLTWADVKVQMTRQYAPPSQAHRNRSRFLVCRQGKSKLAAYVQKLRTLIAAMVIDPMPEAVHGLHGGLPSWRCQNGSLPGKPSVVEWVLKTA
ncbi:unnamed protein product [Peronospora belbahrii]|uniref:Retrotransposon gag domain-containing protein n=1 Tax=Peronospora belbahrii TaxID=622444 RepID=A0AAU9L1I3_9STRA|nr:unnamed protein product [Peronospora belbahrii]